MKALVIFAALMIGAQAQAKTICTVNAQNATDPNTYDQILFTGELGAEPKMLAIKPGSNQAQAVTFGSLSSLDAWKAIDGYTFVSLSRHNDGVGIVTGRVDVSKSQNMLPIDAIATGPVIQGQPLNLVAVKRKISTVCFEN